MADPESRRAQIEREIAQVKVWKPSADKTAMLARLVRALQELEQ